MADFTTGSLPSGATLTRGSTGWYFDSTPALASAATDVARLTYDLATGLVAGTFNEPAATNLIRNSAMGGGTGGSPGTAPTNMTAPGTNGGLTQTISFGTENGIPGVYITLTGTSSSSAGRNFFFETTTGIPGLTGETCTLSAFLKLTAGTLSGVGSIGQRLRELNSGGGGVLELAAPELVGSVTSTLTRFDRTLTTSGGATVAYLQPALRLGVNSGQTVNFTLFIGAPQFVKAASASSPIISTSGAVTRAADALSLARGNGTYDIDITRVSGVTHLTGVVVSGGSWTVPTDVSPLQTVTFTINASAAITDEDDAVAAAIDLVILASAALFDEDDLVAAALTVVHVLVHWPRGVLRPLQVMANCTPFSRSGGRSLDGIARAIRTDLGYWRISFKGVVLSTVAQRRMYNAVRTELGGVAGLAAIPVWSHDANGSLGPAYTLHSDDTPHSDSTPYAQPRIVVEMAADVAIGATSATLRIVSGIDELAGVRWSYNHALYETGLPTAIDGADWTVRLFPAVRAPIPAGARLEFDMPTCLVHLATDTAMDASLSRGLVDRADVDFVEATDVWADLAEAA